MVCLLEHLIEEHTPSTISPHRRPVYKHWKIAVLLHQMNVHVLLSCAVIPSTLNAVLHLPIMSAYQPGTHREANGVFFIFHSLSVLHHHRCLPHLFSREEGFSTSFPSSTVISDLCTHDKSLSSVGK